MNGVVLLKAQLFQIKPESRSKEPNLEFRGLEVSICMGMKLVLFMKMKMAKHDSMKVIFSNRRKIVANGR